MYNVYVKLQADQLNSSKPTHIERFIIGDSIIAFAGIIQYPKFDRILSCVMRSITTNRLTSEFLDHLNRNQQLVDVNHWIMESIMLTWTTWTFTNNPRPYKPYCIGNKLHE